MGQARKKGVLVADKAKTMGVLDTGQDKKWGLPRHIHVLDIYVSAPPPR